MTKKQANKIIDELGCKDTVKNILSLLNGETLEDAKNILGAVSVVLESGLVDAESLKDVVDDLAE